MKCRNCGLLSTQPFEKCVRCGTSTLTAKRDPDMMARLKTVAKDRRMEDLVEYINNSKRTGAPLVLTMKERDRASKFQADLKKDFTKAMTKLHEGGYDG